MVRWRVQSLHITAIQHHRDMFPNDQQQQLAPEPPIDWRQQILANALILFPQIVALHCAKYPALPPRANDIFEVSVSTATANTAAEDGETVRHTFRRYGLDYGLDDRLHFHATLTHSHGDVPAARVVLISSAVELSVGAALKQLFLFTARCICEGHEELCPQPKAMPIFRPGQTGLADFDYTALTENVGCAFRLRAKAEEFDKERQAARTGWL